MHRIQLGWVGGHWTSSFLSPAFIPPSSTEHERLSSPSEILQIISMSAEPQINSRYRYAFGFADNLQFYSWTIHQIDIIVDTYWLLIFMFFQSLLPMLTGKKTSKILKLWPDSGIWFHYDYVSGELRIVMVNAESSLSGIWRICNCSQSQIVWKHWMCLFTVSD